MNPALIICFAQGVGGAVQYPKDYLKEAYKLVRERGGVCIADEVCYFLYCMFMHKRMHLLVCNFYIC